LEIDIDDPQALKSHAPQGEYMKHAPLRILSFDIECAGRKDHFPEAHIDPVIQIANVLSVQGQSTPIAKNVFTLGTCAPIVGAQIIACKTEQEMLSAWKDFFIIVSYGFVEPAIQHLMIDSENFGF
jgi:DNA polymerase delta subunit 1